MSTRYPGSWKMLAGTIGLILIAGSAQAQANERYNPRMPSRWAADVTNPYFPLTRGSSYNFSGKTEDGTETGTVEVLSRTRTVHGVTATAVRDRVYLDGKQIEETEDWYAQDAEGNVWYLGEDSKEMKDGRVTSTEGSWEWGVNGALPGIVMWSDPMAHVGKKYLQEYLKGEAEDFAVVVRVGQNITVPAGSYSACITTDDGSALEPGVIETKTYCPKVGFVLETVPNKERIELITIKAP